MSLEEAIKFGGRRLEVAWPARRWTPELRHEYAEALRAIGDERAIHDGITQAVRGWGGDFPPPVAALCEIVWEAQRKRLEAERIEIDRHESSKPHELAPVWHGYLWRAAAVRSMRIRGRAAPFSAHLQPYLDLAERLGLRCEHGCGEFWDSDGRLHAADPEYDRGLTEHALAEAQLIFGASGMVDDDATRAAAVGAMTGVARP